MGRRGKKARVHGVVVVDKPAGVTSHDVVDKMRRVFGQRRVGHGGTLDPFATGVLPIMLGEGTKLSTFITEGDKTYEGIMRFGRATDSCDRDGETIAESGVPDISAEELQTICDGFLGVQQQLPPMFSAVKVGGRPLYEAAREGKEIEREAKEIEIYAFHVLAWEAPDLHFELSCSKGAYVRTIVADVAESMGYKAYLESLRRTAAGPYEIEDAGPLEEFAEAEDADEFIIPLADALPDLPRIDLDDDQERNLRNGQEALFIGEGRDGLARFVDANNRLVAIGELKQVPGGTNRLWSMRVLRGFTAEAG